MYACLYVHVHVYVCMCTCACVRVHVLPCPVKCCGCDDGEDANISFVRVRTGIFDFPTQAHQAGVISLKQVALANEMGNPLLAAKCKLFIAWSLMQRGKLEEAAAIIK